MDSKRRWRRCLSGCRSRTCRRCARGVERSSAEAAAERRRQLGNGDELRGNVQCARRHRTRVDDGR